MAALGWDVAHTQTHAHTQEQIQPAVYSVFKKKKIFFIIPTWEESSVSSTSINIHQHND